MCILLVPVTLGMTDSVPCIASMQLTAVGGPWLSGKKKRKEIDLKIGSNCNGAIG